MSVLLLPVVWFVPYFILELVRANTTEQSQRLLLEEPPTGQTQIAQTEEESPQSKAA